MLKQNETEQLKIIFVNLGNSNHPRLQNSKACWFRQENPEQPSWATKIPTFMQHPYTTNAYKMACTCRKLPPTRQHPWFGSKSAFFAHKVVRDWPVWKQPLILVIQPCLYHPLRWIEYLSRAFLPYNQSGQATMHSAMPENSSGSFFTSKSAAAEDRSLLPICSSTSSVFWCASRSTSPGLA